MKLTTIEYHNIYSDLQTSIYRIDDCILSHLRKKERVLLSKYGLPADCIEVLDFDNIPTSSSSIELENALFIFGSVYESMQESFLFIDHSYRVQLLLDGKLIYVNDDLEKFLSCLLEYVLFIEEIRLRSDILGEGMRISEEDYFDIYYRLRKIDRTAIRKNSLWHQFIFDSFVYERAVYEYDSENPMF